MHFVSRNRRPIAASIVVLLVFTGIPFCVPRTGTNWPPSLGDWGDFIAGAMAIIAFIWLIAGHHETQQQLVATNRDLEIQSEATREVVSALATIAAANKVQVGDLFADAQPIFVPMGSLATDIDSVTFRVNKAAGYVSVRNEGALAKLIGVRSLQPDMTAELRASPLCPTGCEFRIVVQSAKPLKTAGPLAIVLEFDDKLQTRGWARITANSFDELPHVEHGHGQYPG